MKKEYVKPIVEITSFQNIECIAGNVNMSLEDNPFALDHEEE